MAEQERRRRWIRVVVLVTIAIVVLILLFTVVFPWVETLRENPTIGFTLTGPGRG